MLSIFKIVDVAKVIYVGGICASAIYGIRDKNLELDQQKKLGDKINYADYAIESLGGLMFGATTGILLPLTLIGRASVMFVSREEEKKT